MSIREDEKIAPHCEFIHVHDKVVKQVMDVMPEGEELQNLAEFFRIFRRFHEDQDPVCAQPVGVMCVCVTSQVFSEWDSPRSPTSFDPETDAPCQVPQEGKSVLYSLADGHIQTILAQGMEHIGE